MGLTQWLMRMGLMTGLFRKQMQGVAGAAPAIAISLLAWTNAPQLLAHLANPADDTAARLAYAAQWMLVPGLTLLAGVFGASRRGFYADAIEGTRTPSSYSLEINLRYNQNTIEQTILAAIAWCGLSQVLPHSDLVLIPVMAALFFVGRLTFWIGYALHPMARTFGMTLTAVPTILAYGGLVWAFLR
jgi:hypothetical protein